jgi:hypothetical protein
MANATKRSQTATARHGRRVLQRPIVATVLTGRVYAALREQQGGREAAALVLAQPFRTAFRAELFR